MLADWYFCNCIKATPRSTSTFLIILEALERPDRDPELLIHALRQLSHTNTWMRIYALPRILGLLTSESIFGGRSLILEYLEDLARLLPGETAGLVLRVVDALLSDRLPTPKEVLQIGLQVKNLPARQPATSPYLDLREFLPEIFLLSLMSHMLDRDVATYRGIFSRNSAESVELRACLVSAQEGAFGRLPFLLSLRVFAFLVGPEQLTTSIFSHSNCPHLEPDLLLSLAHLSFYDDDRSSRAAAMIDESLTMSIFRQSWSDRNFENNPALPTSTQRDPYLLAIILWQSTLWSLAVEMDPENAAGKLSTLWQTPQNVFPVLRVHMPERFRHVVDQDCLDHLMRSRWVKIQREGGKSGPSEVELKLELEFVPSASLGRETWIFYSPWLSQRKGPRKPDPQHLRYPDARNPALLLRLLVSAVLSSKLLQTTSRDSNLAALLVHSADVLTTYRYWLANHERLAEAQLTLPDAWTAAALFAQDQISSVARCTDLTIEPEIFMELLRGEGANSTNGSEDLELFRRSVVPWVLVDWILDSYVAASAGSGSGRWFAAIPEVFQRMRQAKVVGQQLIKAAALVRFFRKDIPIDLSGPPNLHWQVAESAPGVPLHWRANHLQFFLTPDLAAEEWHRPEWSPKQERFGGSAQESGEEIEEGNAQKLVRAIERRAALKRPEGLSPDLVEDWRSEWMSLLSAIARLQDLDRLIRVRLLELLEDKQAQLSSDEQSLIALAILEYGSHYDVERLFAEAFPLDREGRLLDPDDPARQDLRCRLLYAMFQFVRRHESQDMENPRIAQRESRRTLIVKEALWTIAFQDGAGPTQRELRRQLQGHIQRFWDRRLREVPVVEANLIQAGQRKTLTVESSPVPPDWSLRSGLYNGNDGLVRLAVEFVDLKGTEDVFSQKLADFHKVHQNNVVNVLGIVVSVQKEGRKYACVFNCGLPLYLRAIYEECDYKSGDLVSLPLQAIRQGDRISWAISGRRPAGRIAKRTLSGCFEWITVTTVAHGLRAPLEFYVGKTPRTSWNPRDGLRVWDPDLSRSYQRIPKSREVVVIARPQDSARWMPPDRDFCEFLAREITAPERQVSLTLIEEVEDLGPHASWRFSARPGINYLLDQRCFEPEAAFELNGEIQRLENPNGLIVTVEAHCSGGTVRLGLGHASGAGVDQSGHLGLSIPFDLRNLAWRGLFANRETVDVSRESDQWCVELGPESVPGFPDRIPVQVNQYLRGKGPYQVTVEKWEPREGQLLVEAVYRHPLTVPLDKRADFLKYWLDLKTDHELFLTRTIGQIMEDGYVKCLTGEGAVVFVEAESITMGFLQATSGQDLHRIGLVTATPRWSRPAEVSAERNDIPAEIWSHHEPIGILAKVPANLDAETGLCEVWWLIDNDVVPNSLHIPQSVLRGTLIGSKVTLTGNGADRRLHIQTRRIRVRTSWQLKDEHYEVHDSVLFLGTLEHRGQTVVVAEAGPGLLVILPSGTRARHLAEGVTTGPWTGGIDPSAMLKNSAAEWLTWIESNTRMRRARFVTPTGLIVGNCGADSPDQQVTATVRLQLRNAGSNRYVLRRNFELVAARVSMRAPSRREEENKNRKQDLEKYFGSPRDIPVEISPSEDTVRLFTLKVPSEDAQGWTDTCIIADGDGPYIRGVKYPHTGKARLLKTSTGQFRASFRQVEAMNVGMYKNEVASDIDEMPISVTLYYAGPENGSDGSLRHRFEWGYGASLLAHEEELLFDGAPFTAASGILFLSDRITQVRFTKSEQNDSDSPWIMGIQSVDLDFSFSTNLYHQRSRFSIVHILELTIHGGEFRIKSIVGFSNEFVGSSEKVASIRTFEGVQAQLTPDSQRQLSRALKDGAQLAQQGKPLRILGRLDDQEFKNSLGGRVLFQHVKMSFESDDGSATLRDGELIFMEAGEIQPVRNDTVLMLHSYPGLRQSDIGWEYRHGSRLFRRDFSAREDLLRVILEREGSCARQYTIYLVRIEGGDRRVHKVLHERMPTRRPESLVSEIARTKGPLLATVVRTRANDIKVELKPGAYFLLARSAIEHWYPDLEPGTLVRIEIESSRSTKPRFRIAPAAFGDAHYVPQDTRPCVALPKNPLLDRNLQDPEIADSAFWAKAGRFSMSGLAGVQPACGTYSPNLQTWSKPDAEQFVNLMKVPHPKIVRLGKDDFGRFRISLYDDEWPAGTLHIEGLTPKFRPAGSTAGEDDRTLKWSHLTFTDKPVTGILKLFANRVWKAHDSESGYWTAEGGYPQLLKPETLFAISRQSDHEASSVAQNLKPRPSDRKRAISVRDRRATVPAPSDAVNGVVFFEREGEAYRLRYDPSSFARFGFPVDELLESIAREPNATAWYTVAGVSTMGGLWIEICPGRLSEIPGQLMVLVDGRSERPLASMEWFAFAAGDQVKLQLRSDRSLTVDRVVFLDWIPGPRGAFTGDTFLPVCFANKKDGSLVLGAGQYLIELPFAEPFRQFELGLLKKNNELADATGSLPGKNDIVLLGLNAQRLPCILGFPEWRPFPEIKNESWDDDPLADLIASRTSDLLEACGGALPVTVEGVLPDKRILSFSRRRQSRLTTFRATRILPATIAGVLRGGETAILRCGALLLPAHINSIVPGLPLEFSAAIASVLNRIRVWVRRDTEDASVQFGFKEEDLGEFFVEPVSVMPATPDASSSAGMICRSPESLKLYWLAAPEAAWASLTNKDLKTISAGGGREEPFKVLLGSEGKRFNGVSAVEVESALREFQGLRVGQELDVRVVSKREGDDALKYLVRSLSTGMILECEMFRQDRIQVGCTIAVEVTRKNAGSPRNVVVVPLGQKRYILALPEMMFSNSVKAGGLSSGFQDFLKWREEHMETISGVGSAMSDRDLNRAICIACNSLTDQSSDVRPLAEIAVEWMKRNINNPEMKPEFALMAIVTLYECGERGREHPQHKGWRRAAVDLCRNLTRRALGAVHIEVLRHRLFYQESLSTASPEFVARLEHIRHILAPTLGVGETRLLDQFCRAAELRSSSTAALIADALAAMLGRTNTVQGLLSMAPVSSELISVFRTLPISHSGFPAFLDLWHARQLKKILNYIESQKVDLAFGEPIPTLVASDNDLALV